MVTIGWLVKFRGRIFKSAADNNETMTIIIPPPVCEWWCKSIYEVKQMMKRYDIECSDEKDQKIQS